MSGEGSLRRQVEAALRDDVNPILMQDNGFASLVDVKAGIVTVRMEGMCAHCPQAQTTFEAVICKTLKEKVPGVMGVRLDDEDDRQMLAIARAILCKDKKEQQRNE